MQTITEPYVENLSIPAINLVFSTSVAQVLNDGKIITGTQVYVILCESAKLLPLTGLLSLTISPCRKSYAPCRKGARRFC